jgi:hypothetical protein
VTLGSVREQGGTGLRHNHANAGHDLALEFCTQAFHPLTYFSLYPFIGVERAVEPVNVLNMLSSKPDLNTPASSGSRRHDRKRNAVIFSNHRKVSNPLDWRDLSMLIHEVDQKNSEDGANRRRGVVSD